MPRSISRSVRYAFVALAGGLLLVAGVQSVAVEARMGLSTCGWEGNPCVLEALVVTAPPAAAPATEVVRSAAHTLPSAPQVPVAQS